jgi:hypothetical protein
MMGAIALAVLICWHWKAIPPMGTRIIDNQTVFRRECLNHNAGDHPGHLALREKIDEGLRSVGMPASQFLFRSRRHYRVTQPALWPFSLFAAPAQARTGRSATGAWQSR